jgi:F0F1-type ATP synthase membrane subunit b/b'
MEPVPTDLNKYLGIVGAYDSEFKKWEGRVKKILRKYRDDTRGQTGNETAKFNILWSNVQTLIPAVYARLPKADVSRRFGDNDPVSRVASMLIERALDYEIEHYPDFRATMKHCVEDRFLGGRGVAWVRYEPHVTTQDIPDDGLEITEDIEVGEGADWEKSLGQLEQMDQQGRLNQQEQPEPMEQIDYECAPTDYVHWKDFGHSTARTWEEVTCVWRWVFMSYDALVERFGEDKAKKIPLDQGPEPLNAYNESKKANNRAKVCELWDKEQQKVFWFSKSLNEFIDERGDPLELEGFFPCPPPLFATTTSDSLVPVPDFTLYQDQAAELDVLSDRIDGLVKALRVRGVYDASQPALQRLLTEGGDNDLIPVDKWSALSEKGGLKGAIDLLPLDMIAGALGQCYQAREDIKQQVYEITGISDIIRGASFASETATAQQIKGQYAGLRLKAMQEDVALFATALIRLKAQIICTKFQPETILKYAAADQLQPVDQQMIPQALQLIKDDPLRSFRIEVAADSLIQLDEQQSKQDRMEFLNAMGGFVNQMMPVITGSPQLAPMMIELMKFGVGAFKQAKQLEGVIDQVMEQSKQQPQQQRPDPEMAKVQGQQQLDQMRLQHDVQVEQAKIQANAQIEQQKLAADQQIEQQKIAATQQIEQQKVEFERWKAELEAGTKLMVADIGAKSAVGIAQFDAQLNAVNRPA